MSSVGTKDIKMAESSKIPKHWKTVISADILDIRDGTHDTPKYVIENGVPLITSKNLKDNDIDFKKTSFISKEDHLEISKRSKVEEGDILFAMIGTIGNPAIIKGDANFSIKNVGLFKKNEKVILPTFLVNYLRSSIFERQLADRKLLKGTTQKFIPLGNLRKIELPLPALPEQQAIVSKIEELFSELDNGIAQLKTAQQQLTVYRQSLLKWAFEGKLTSSELGFVGLQDDKIIEKDNKKEILKSTNLKNPNSDKGELPKGWKVENMGSVIEKPKYGTSKKCDYGIIGKAVIRIPNIGNGIVDNSDLKFAEFDNSEIETYELKEGDILTIRSNGSVDLVGKCALIKKFDEDYLFAGYLIRLRPLSDVIMSKFLLYVLSSHDLRKQIESKAKSTSGVNNINTDELKSLLIPLCSLAQQQLIVSELESKLTVCDKIEETISQSLQQAETLRQSILKKAFEGKLVKMKP